MLVHPHREGFCAVIGGYVARDRSLGRLYGRCVYGDDRNPSIWSARLRPARVYAVSLLGPVYRLTG